MLVLISGPSGSGKTTIIKQIVRDHPEYIMAHSTTTRAMRLKDNESEGNPYHFVSDEEFTEMTLNGKFFEWNVVHGNRYGLSKDYIDMASKPDTCVIKDIDVEGHKEYLKLLKDMDIDVFSVYIGVAPQILTKRLSRQKYENSYAKNYDFVVQNVNPTDSKMIAKCIEYKIQDTMRERSEATNAVTK